MEQKRIKVILTKNSPYSAYGYYEKGDVGYIDGYVNDNAVIILENGKFAKADLRWIEVVNEEDKNTNTELKESESDDEKIRKGLLYVIEHHPTLPTKEAEGYIAWLEKQGEHANFCNKIQIGDKVTRNEDGVLVNLSQLNRVAKKQGEQKPTDKVEPKFHAGDFITDGERIFQIEETVWERNNRNDGTTYCESLIVNLKDGNMYANNTDLEEYHLWTIQDAKEGDVLACPNDAGDRDVVFIFKNINSDEGWVFCFCASDANGCFCTNNDYVGNSNSTSISPATKEQRDLLFQKMKESGYEWDAEKKELKKIEQKSAENKGMNIVEEDMTPFQKKVFCIIDTAIEEEQGLKQVCDELLMLAHDEIIQKPAWSEEDKNAITAIIAALSLFAKEKDAEGCFDTEMDWLKSLKERVQPQPQWKPSDEQMEILLSEVSAWTKGCPKQKILESLYNDLKKLK